MSDAAAICICILFSGLLIYLGLLRIGEILKEMWMKSPNSMRTLELLIKEISDHWDWRITRGLGERKGNRLCRKIAETYDES